MSVSAFTERINYTGKTFIECRLGVWMKYKGKEENTASTGILSVCFLSSMIGAALLDYALQTLTGWNP